MIVAGVALLMANWSNWGGYGLIAHLLMQVALAVYRSAVELGPTLALVVLARRGQYGGPLRSAEWLALGLASLRLVNSVPNLDTVVNAYHAAVGSTALDFGVARWMLSAPAIVGAGLIAVLLAVLRRPARAGSRLAAAFSVIGIVGGLGLWFWGPCALGSLELPWLLVPSPAGDPATWGWRAQIVAALRAGVATAPFGVAWGLLGAAAVRSWRAERRGTPRRRWVWTEPVALAVALVAAVLHMDLAQLNPGAHEPAEIAGRAAGLFVAGLSAWWITGRLGVGAMAASNMLAECNPSRKERSST
jgi:hypothetical protein